MKEIQYATRNRTSYEKVKEFASYTTSKDFGVRLFEFGFAVLLYIIWLVVDFLVQKNMPGPVRSKPRITASRFLNFVEDRFHRLI